MKLRSLMVALLAMALLLGGCKKDAVGSIAADLLYEKMGVSQQEGHFFFAGKVLSALSDSKQITYYEEQMEKNTFYQVEITDDFFGCMPDRVVTVCVLGGSENFPNRQALEPKAEYIFDTTLWLCDGEAVFLLPTFYDALPEKSGEDLYYTDRNGKGLLEDSYEDYKAAAIAMAETSGYSPETVLNSMKERLELAEKERTVARFEELKFADLDVAAVKAVNDLAVAYSEKCSTAEKTWEGIKDILE